MIGIGGKRIVGLYVGAGRLHVAAVEGNRFGWKPVAVERSTGLSGGGSEGGLAALRDLLRQVNPDRRIRWYLALPRSNFFFRDIPLPAMPLEDALDAVQGMVRTLVHLPLEDIYFDVQMARKPDRTIRALLVYGLKQMIDPYRDVFRETGHEAGLEAIFPFTVGVAAYLSWKRFPFPTALDIPYRDGREIAVIDDLGCRATFFTENGDSGGVQDFLKSQGLDVESVLSLREDAGRGPQFEIEAETMPSLADIRANRAEAALACGVCSQQIVSVDGRPTRLKLFPLWKTIGFVVAALTIGCTLWTDLSYRTVERNQAVLGELREKRHRLEQQLHPLEKNKQSAEKAKQLIADMDEFMSHRPQLFRLINDIAERVPEGTWFSRFTFGEKEISMQGQSRDAIKTLEALRASPFLDQVKLSGSVMKAPNGLEQFTMSMKRKEEKAADHGQGEQPHS